MLIKKISPMFGNPCKIVRVRRYIAYNHVTDTYRTFTNYTESKKICVPVEDYTYRFKGVFMAEIQEVPQW